MQDSIYTRWPGMAKEGAYAGQHFDIMLLQCLPTAIFGLVRQWAPDLKGQ